MRLKRKGSGKCAAEAGSEELGSQGGKHRLGPFRAGWLF